MSIKYNIGIIGVGVLGTAILETFEDYNTLNKLNTTKPIINLYPYDKYKNIGNFEDILNTNIIFICLPTEYSQTDEKYNIKEIINILNELSNATYKGIILLKSTVEPQTTVILYKNNRNLRIIHNPEFLSAKTAKNDFMHQTHIILGLLPDTHNETILYIINFYSEIFDAKLFNSVLFNEILLNKEGVCDFKNNSIISSITEFKANTNIENIDDNLRPIISLCSTTESESVKLFCNAFYATKIQFFTEIKLLCDNMGINYNNVRDMMILNRWINPMHTIVPGDDNKISFGGKCFPKDIKALNSFMNQNNTPHEVIQSVVNENNIMRCSYNE